MTETTCLADGCQRSDIIARGLCESHYRKLQRRGLLGDCPYPINTREVKRCSVDGCERPSASRGWCTTHYSRWRRFGDPLRERMTSVIPPGAETATCRSCGAEKPVRQFVKSSRKYGSKRIQPCQKCHYAQYRDFYKEKTRIYRVEKRMKALLAYGGKCACCGERREFFLTLDHVNNDGKEHREEIGTSQMWWWLEKNRYPDGFQVLCANCHLAKTKNGACTCQTSSSLCRPSLIGTTAETLWNGRGKSEHPGRMSASSSPTPAVVGATD